MFQNKFGVKYHLVDKRWLNYVQRKGEQDERPLVENCGCDKALRASVETLEKKGPSALQPRTQTSLMIEANQAPGAQSSDTHTCRPQGTDSRDSNPPMMAKRCGRMSNRLLTPALRVISLSKY